MKTIVLDATQLSRDYMCRGLPYQLLEHMLHATWVDVYVPAAAFEETVANFGRAVKETAAAIERVNRSHRILGLPAIEPAMHESQFEYRAHLAERFDEKLGITVLPWPTVSHVDLVMRAVERRRPFDAKGSGYRDSLLWADILGLARSGHDVALVSSDKIFADSDGRLATSLADEIEDMPGAVELVSDFGTWLVAHLPWEETDLRSAVAQSRTEEFYNYYLQSDLQDELTPEIEELGFSRRPLHCSITSVEWTGSFGSVDASEGPDGVALVKYDLSQDVEFEATFSQGYEPEPGWAIAEEDAFREVRVGGVIPMIVRVAVLFGDDEFGFSIDDLLWRRADGRGPGFDLMTDDPNQLSLLE